MAVLNVQAFKDRIVKALTPWFLGRDQDALIEAMKQFSEETLVAVEVDTDALQDQFTNLYSNAGAGAIGTASGNSVQEELDAVGSGLAGKVNRTGDTMTGKLTNTASIHVPSGTMVLGAPLPENLYWNYTYPGNTYVTMDKATADNDASLVFTQGGRAKWEFGATTEGPGVSPRIHMKVVRNPTANPADDQFLDVMLWDYDSGNVWVNNGYRLGVGTLPQERLHVAGFNVSGARVISKFENFNTGAGSQSAAHVFQGVGTAWNLGNDFGLNAGHNFFVQDGNSGNLRFFADANGVSIGGSTVAPTEILRADSTTGGFLPPRMTTTQRDAMGGKNAGLTIYNTTAGALQVWNGATWQAMASGNFVTTDTPQTITAAKTFTSTITATGVSASGTVSGNLQHRENGGYFLIGSFDTATYGTGSGRVWWRPNNTSFHFWDSTGTPATIRVGSVAAQGSMNVNMSDSPSNIATFIQPGSSPAGSTVDIGSPVSVPGVVGTWSGTARSDIRFQNGSMFLGSSATTAQPSNGLTITPTTMTWSGNTVWHAGNDGPGSGLNADNVHGIEPATTSAINTLAVRNGSGDIFARLYRSEFANETTIAGAIAYRVNNTTDNYIRFCSNPAAVKTWLTIDSRDAPLFVTTANATTTLSTTHLNGVIEKSNTTAYTYTIAPSLGAQGNAITVINSGTAGNITLARGVGVALYRNGVDADLTVGPGSMVTIYRSATANRWIAD